VAAVVRAIAQMVVYAPSMTESLAIVGPADLELHRAALTGHCYRMLGSIVDADDAVQETLVRAWRGLARFDGRASLSTWLYRIATNVCLDSLSHRSRRFLPLEEGSAGSIDGELTERPREHWLEPAPDSQVIPREIDPSEAMLLRESVRLAFVAALQYLPARQRAALLLTDVLGFSTSEVAECLEMSLPAVNSALQRARATLQEKKGSQLPDAKKPWEPEKSRLLKDYVDAFQRYDTEALTALLSQDAIMSMPPISLWFQGRKAIRSWLEGRGNICRDSRLVPIEASGAPAYGQYHRSEDGMYRPWSIIVLDVGRESIREMTFFLDTATLFPRFGLPPVL
jgi:RNA polymerase sigma-70 factor, ECF subfamily